MIEDTAEYAMPLDRLASARLRAALLTALCVPLFIVAVWLLGLAASMGAITYVILEATLVFVPLAIILQWMGSPILRHDRLEVGSAWLVPLSKPVFAPRGRRLTAADVKAFSVEAWGPLANGVWRIRIEGTDGRRYRVNSLVLSKYDDDSKRVKAAAEALLRLRASWGYGGDLVDASVATAKL